MFFTSPIYCTTMCDTVVAEMNRIHKLFKSRNPSYTGAVSLMGHSLGSCILFDILAGQDSCENAEDGVATDPPIAPMNTPPTSTGVVASKSPSPPGPGLPTIEELCKQMNLLNLLPVFQEEQIDTETIMMCSESDLKDLEIPFGPRKKLLAFIQEHQYKMSNPPSETASPQGETASPQQQSPRNETVSRQPPTPPTDQTAKRTPSQTEFLFEKTNTGIGQPLVKYKKLEFETSCLFSLGSPIGLFLTARGVHNLGADYKLPHCMEFFNIFHPYDPVAYRVEPLINAETIELRPSLIPHHKGRKRLHLELKDNLSRASTQIKNSIMGAVNSTWTSISAFAKAHRGGEEAEETTAVGESAAEQSLESVSSENSLESLEEQENLLKEKSMNFGKLNDGRRVDFVLQENPMESLNEYIFALGSHLCYWKSDDTALLVVDNIYKRIK